MGAVGREVQVVGVFRNTGNRATTQVPATITFWKFLGPPEPRAKGPIKSTPYTLEALVQNPGKHDGQIVRVIGKFDAHRPVVFEAILDLRVDFAI